MATQQSGNIVVFGAGGRAGRALAAEALGRGHWVTAVVRDPRRHQDMGGPGVRLVAGDATDPACAPNVADGALALVNAVTPFSTPPDSFDGFDPAYYARLAKILANAADQAHVGRVIEIGLAATLKTGTGRLYEDPDSFPLSLRPFAQARVRGIEAWQRRSNGTDWLIVTQPPGRSLDAPITGRYQLADDTLDATAGQFPLSYADLAVAVVDQGRAPDPSPRADRRLRRGPLMSKLAGRTGSLSRSCHMGVDRDLDRGRAIRWRRVGNHEVLDMTAEIQHGCRSQSSGGAHTGLWRPSVPAAQQDARRLVPGSSPTISSPCLCAGPR